MKKIISLFSCLLCLISSAQEEYFITAKSGLNVRSQASLSSQKIAKIPYGVSVLKLADTKITLTISDQGKPISGKWIKIRYDNYLYLVSKETEQFQEEGYVFDGYLQKIEDTTRISTHKIEKPEYDALVKNAFKPHQKSKKITDFDAIKHLLKNRINWFTELNEYGHKREDAIKSITTKNGQKLIINQISNDYGFSEGWSGYYPAYDILVLEGGHTSDMCFSIATGQTHSTIGNPEYIIASPKNTYRLNGDFGGQECISYFFQKEEKGIFTYITTFNWDTICTLKSFNWLSETNFIYTTLNYATDSENGTIEYFKGEVQ